MKTFFIKNVYVDTSILFKAEGRMSVLFILEYQPTKCG